MAAEPTPQDMPIAGGAAPATTWKRFVGGAIDWIIGAILMVAIGAVFPVFDTLRQLFAGAGDELAQQFAGRGFYIVVTSAYIAAMLSATGDTIGSKLARVKIVTLKGDRPSFGLAFARSVVMLLLSPFFIFYWPAFRSAERRGLHDMAGETKVLEAQQGG